MSHPGAALHVHHHVERLESAGLQIGHHRPHVLQLVGHLGLTLLTPELRSLLERLGEVLHPGPPLLLPLNVCLENPNKLGERLAPSLLVHHVQQILRVELRQYLAPHVALGVEVHIQALHIKTGITNNK